MGLKGHILLLVYNLKLKPISSQLVELNTFGGANAEASMMKFYSFCLTNPNKGCRLYLSGFAVPTICAALRSYKREILVESFSDFDEFVKVI